jgi:hypothetical protein
MLVAHVALLAFTASLACPERAQPVQRVPAAPIQQIPQTKPQQLPSATREPQQALQASVADLGVDIDRIQRALAHTPRLRFDEMQKPVVRVQVFGEKPTIEDILGPDFWKGPVPHGGMTHQEFLDLVTPEDVQGYAAFSNKEGATVAATSFLLQWTLQRAIQKYNVTEDRKAREAARQEVQQALDALEQARAKAGLRREHR